MATDCVSRRDLPVTARQLLVQVFAPFACGYFFSFMLRNINSVVFPDIVAAFSLGPDALGALTSAYFFAFAAFQVPLGMLLDRFGPRRVNGTLLLVAATGTLLFAVAQNLAMLITARALMGLGFCGCLMSSMMAFILWYPRSSMATLSGWMLAIGAAGALVATAPVEFALRTIDWRALFILLSALVTLAATLILLSVPEQPRSSPPLGFQAQLSGIVMIARDSWFWRMGLLAAITQAGALALLGLWAGPWLRDIGLLERPQIARHLLVFAAAFGLGGIVFGTLSDRLARRGIAPQASYLAGSACTTALLLPLALGVSWSPLTLWSAFIFCAASGTLAYPLLTAHFPVEMSGRVLTAINVLTMACAFVFQAGAGTLINLWPSLEGRYDPAGYRAAFGIIFLLQLASLLWATIPPRASRTSA